MTPIQNSSWQQPESGNSAENLLGEVYRLLEELGSLDGLGALSAVTSSLQVQRVDTLPALKIFLQNYLEQILLPLELPAIARARTHALRSEVREMIAFDQQLAGEPLWLAFTSASQRVGRSQLERLRPLRDQRVVQRYLAAVECGQARGWHTIVYGLTLAIYSLPLRQSLIHYAEQTLRGFASAAARQQKFSEMACAEILENLSTRLPAAIEEILASTEQSELVIR